MTLVVWEEHRYKDIFDLKFINIIWGKIMFKLWKVITNWGSDKWKKEKKKGAIHSFVQVK